MFSTFALIALHRSSDTARTSHVHRRRHFNATDTPCESNLALLEEVFEFLPPVAAAAALAAVDAALGALVRLRLGGALDAPRHRLPWAQDEAQKADGIQYYRAEVKS